MIPFGTDVGKVIASNAWNLGYSQVVLLVAFAPAALDATWIAGSDAGDHDKNPPVNVYIAMENHNF